MAKGPQALHVYTIETGACIGFGVVALLCAGLHFAISSTTPSAPLPSLLVAAGNATAGGIPASLYTSVPTVGAWVGGQAIIATAQLLGVFGQYSTVKLGQNDAEASSFLPMISTYTVLVAILGIVVLHESMAPLGYVGMAAAGVGVVLIASA